MINKNHKKQIMIQHL